MADADIRMKKGDRLPSVATNLKNPDGSFTNLTGATVVFRYQLDTTPPGTVTSITCVIDDPIAGAIHIDWGVTDTAVAGTYRAEFVATISGKDETFPTEGFLVFIIEPDVS